MQIVLAVLAGLLGGVIGYAASRENPGAIVLGAAIGGTLVWGAASVLIWIISGFLAE
jgi:hypothetical protein